MPLTELARSIIEQPLPKEKIKQRPGKAGMTYDYVTPDFVIDLLNKAFEYRWHTRIVSNAMHGDTVVVGLELTVYDAEGEPISKQQFGSCDVGRGMGVGEAFKGAASDALKKAAALVGVALELYRSDETPVEMGPPQFKRPASPVPPPPPARPAAPSATPQAPKPSAPAPRPAAPAPPAPVQVPPGTTRAMPRVGEPAASVAKPVAAPRSNPFDKGKGNGAAPPAPRPTAAPPKPQTHPFGSATEAEGPNSTQLNALVNLSQKKSLSPAEMIAKANVADAHGAPKQVFEDLTRSEAIQVIRAAQL